MIVGEVWVALLDGRVLGVATSKQVAKNMFPFEMEWLEWNDGKFLSAVMEDKNCRIYNLSVED